MTASMEKATDHTTARAVPRVALWGFYGAITCYFASLVIFARPDNVIYSNLANLLMVGYFLILEIFYGDRTLYFDSVTTAYGLFFIYCLVSLFWTIDYEISAEMIGRMVKITINLFIVYNILRKYRMVSAIFTGLFLGTVANILIEVHLVPIHFSPYFPGTVRFMGTTINPNITSTFMFFSIFVSILWLEITRKRIFIVMGMLNIVLSYYIILLTVSRTGLVVAMGFILAFLFASMFDQQRRRYVFSAFGVVALFSLLFFDQQHLAHLEKVIHFGLERIGYIFASLSGEGVEHSADERLSFIRVALHTFSEHPVFGTGVDTVRSYQGVYSHNNYTELLANNGLVGFTLYYLMYIAVLIKAWQVRDRFLQFFLVSFVLAVLLYDMGGVSYYGKLNLMMLVLAGYIADIFARRGDAAASEVV